MLATSNLPNYNEGVQTDATLHRPTGAIKSLLVDPSGNPIGVLGNAADVNLAEVGGAVVSPNLYNGPTQSLQVSVVAGGVPVTSDVTIRDPYGFNAENTPFGEIRTVTPVRLVGANFDLGAGAVDTNFWSTAVDVTAGPGTVVASGSEALLNSGTDAAAFARLWSNRRARFVGGSSLRFRGEIQLGDTGTANNVRRWGAAYGGTMPTITDGAYFQLAGNVLSVVTMKGGVATIVSSGAFNGTFGPVYAPTLNETDYEIYWDNGHIYFVIEDQILHSVVASLATWANTMSMYVYLDNFNTAAQAGNLVLHCRVASISRLGKLETAPIWRHISGIVVASVLKSGPGRLHHVNFNTVPNNSSVTLYDAVTATNPIAVAVAPTNVGAFTQNFDLDFYSGLCISTTPGGIDVTVVYE